MLLRITLDANISSVNFFDFSLSEIGVTIGLDIHGLRPLFEWNAMVESAGGRKTLRLRENLSIMLSEGV